MKFQKGSKRSFRNYEKCSEYERSKLQQGYERLAEYACFYLYGRYDMDGKLLYRECFSKFDIDGVPAHSRVRSPYKFKDF